MARSLKLISARSCMVLVCLLALFPLWWMFATSLKPGRELFSEANPLWPHDATFSNYKQLITDTRFMQWIANSILISTISTGVTLFLAIPAAYAISRFPSRHSRAVALSMVLGYGIPPVILMLPIFVILTRVGLYDQPWTLLLLYPSFLIPFATWLLAGYMKATPKAPEEAARIDGCSWIGTILHVTLPSITSGLRTTTVFCFLLAWGEYVYAMSLVGSSNLLTVPVGISSLQSGDVYQWGLIMAAGTLATLPLAVLLVLSQKSFMRGITAGALKP